MSKLHFYEKGTKVADGDGTINSSGFDANITWGEVKKGRTYTVKQGTSPSGDNYPCTTGATTGNTASFGAKQFATHLKMDFSGDQEVAGAAGGTKYNLVCKNESSTDWVFYVYQTMPSQPSEIFSLAWFASPYKISKGSTITFTWSIDYSFVWGNTGIVSPGVAFSAGGTVPCNLAGANQTTFSLDNNAPQLSTPTSGGQAGSLIVSEAANVPNNIFSTGIGMSGYGTFVQQALANTTQAYTPKPLYWIAAATQMQMGVVLAETVNKAESFDFGPNIYTVNATLGQDNLWTIS